MIKVETLKDLHNEYGELYKDLADNRQFFSIKMIRKVERTLLKNYTYSLKVLNCNLRFDLKQEIKKSKNNRKKFKGKKKGFLKKLLKKIKTLYLQKTKECG